jgi:Flp pilus assembly protein TadB
LKTFNGYAPPDTLQTVEKKQQIPAAASYLRHFLNITVSGQVAVIILLFLKVILFLFVLHVALLLIRFALARGQSRKRTRRSCCRPT